MLYPIAQTFSIHARNLILLSLAACNMHNKTRGAIAEPSSYIFMPFNDFLEK
jgi:hypothetical protein